MTKLLTFDECAERLSVSRSTVTRLARDGSLATVKLGSDQRSAVRVREEDLDAFVQGRRSKRGG